MTNSKNFLPNLGFGLGLRPQHYPHIFENSPNVDWFEIISENFMDTGGRPIRNLERILEKYPVVMHGVALSIGTVDPLNSEYLKKLKNLMEWVKPAWVSDHLCWTGVAHRNTHDLLPIPYTEEALAHIVDRIKRVQDYLGRPIALENPSTYLEFKSSFIPEAEFIARMAEESGCSLLLDVNNIYVSCYNHRLDPKAYIDAMPLDHVIQIHLAGHDNKGTHIVDTHDNHVVGEVWALYKYVVNKAGRIPNTMIEWDDHIPEFAVLYQELEKARIAAADAANYGVLPALSESLPARISNEHINVSDQQARMQDAILSGSDRNPSDWIRDKTQFSPQAQLDVYIKAYRYRLYDVVAEDYPALAYYLGVEKFEKLLWAFINDNQSQHFNIARYAVKLSGYIKENYPDDVFAQEICQLETALTQLADVEESPALEQNALSALSVEALLASVIVPRKALCLLSFTYPVNDFYNRLMADESPAVPDKQSSWLAVFRHEDVMWRADMEENEFMIFSRLAEGVNIEAALSDMDETAGNKLSEWFSRWMHQHFLTEIKLSTEVEKEHAAA